MPSFNWSMTAMGYPEHRRAGAAVVGFSTMSTHEVLRLAEHLGFAAGWLLSEGSNPQLEGLRGSEPAHVQVADLFADRRVAMTDGLASGTLVFVAAPAAAEPPPRDRTLAAWADEKRLPWVEVIDNEVAYWGALQTGHIERLLTWFLGARPLDADWRASRLAPTATGRLLHGLFEHGWTRNLALAKPGGKPSLELWGGVHGTCLLDHANALPPTRVGIGLRCVLAGSEWSAVDAGGRCPLSDDTGKLSR
jgi:hypothetical protein